MKACGRHRALRNLAVTVGMGRDGPALTDGTLGNVVAKYGFELTAAPDFLVEDRRQFNQIGHVHTPIVLRGRRVKLFKTSACMTTKTYANVTLCNSKRSPTLRETEYSKAAPLSKKPICLSSSRGEPGLVSRRSASSLVAATARMVRWKLEIFSPHCSRMNGRPIRTGPSF